ncbi:MAG: BON domain-containing protein [Gloeobacteraceae cyanobacterium ES-bin-316]|nr:BON domain-containing protein [Ferruginibacter sp.]
MKIFKVLPALVLVAGLAFTGCKPKDADIKASIEKSLKETPATAAVMVMVNEGVATLSGEVADAATKTALEAKVKGMKGVKSVQDNTTLPVPVVATPPTITADDPLTSAVRDATKDYPEVTATVADGVVKVTGAITAAKWKSLKMALDGLKPRKVDGSALTIN